MSFGPEFPEVCISTFSTPIEAHALVTGAPDGNVSTAYTMILSSNSCGSIGLCLLKTETLTSKVTVTTGVALEEPVVIAWQDKDLPLFPTEYATSLARRIGVPLPSNTASPQSSASPTSNAQPERAGPELSTGAKAGIGIGAAIGALAIIAAIATMHFRHQKRARAAAALQEHSKPELDGQDQQLKKTKWWQSSAKRRVHPDAMSWTPDQPTQRQIL